MKKNFLISFCVMLTFAFSGLECYSDQVYVIHTQDNTPTALDTIQVKSKDAAKKIRKKTKRAASVTSDFIQDKTEDAMYATGDALNTGKEKATEITTKAGKAAKQGAINVGNATKEGAKKATNFTFRHIRDGADKVIQKTEPHEEIQEQNQEGQF